MQCYGYGERVSFNYSKFNLRRPKSFYGGMASLNYYFYSNNLSNKIVRDSIGFFNLSFFTIEKSPIYLLIQYFLRRGSIYFIYLSMFLIALKINKSMFSSK